MKSTSKIGLIVEITQVITREIVMENEIVDLIFYCSITIGIIGGVLAWAWVRFAVTGLPGLNLSLHGTLCPSTGLCVPPRDFCLEINVYEYIVKRSQLLMSTLICS